ncbi:MAG: hypothetical protein HYZ44_14880 [Bacteroidetes bacterium]|nr:hypothetical protein [Bacteroidota bacterium]
MSCRRAVPARLHRHRAFRYKLPMPLSIRRVAFHFNPLPRHSTKRTGHFAITISNQLTFPSIEKRIIYCIFVLSFKNQKA